MSHDHKNPPQTNVAAPAAAKSKYPDVARVRSVVGDMVHLFTNALITSEEKKIQIDDFARAQLDAGKWVIVTD